MKSEKMLKIVLAISALACAGLTITGKAYKTEAAVTEGGAIGYFAVNVNTYATSLRAATLYTKLKGVEPVSMENIQSVIPGFRMPPRWAFTTEGKIGFQINPYTKKLCEKSPDSDPVIHKTPHVTCKNGQIVIKEVSL